VSDTIKYRLNADQDAIAEVSAFGHPDIPQSGIVPGLSDWEYYFHGRGCCLTHRTSGESIDVDFYDSTADWFDDYFYICYLDSLKEPSYVEERLISLHRSRSTVSMSIRELLELGLLEQFEDSKIVRLAFDYEALCGVLDDIELKWEDVTTQRATCAAVGDWFQLNELDVGTHQPTIDEHLTATCELRTDTLVNQFKSEHDKRDALNALNDLGSPRLPHVVRDALKGVPTGTTSAALDVIDSWDDSGWCDEVVALLDRVNPNGDIPAPHVWYMCAQFLLRHGRTAKIKRKLRWLKSNCLGDATLLALEYFPDIAIETFRKALRSDIPCNRITAAAALAIIDQPWSRDELEAVLIESNDHIETAECRSALVAVHSEEAHRLVEAWEEKNPCKTEEGQYVSMDEMSLRMSDETIQWEMEKLHDRVLPLRSITPEQPKRGWFRRG